MKKGQRIYLTKLLIVMGDEGWKRTTAPIFRFEIILDLYSKYPKGHYRVTMWSSMAGMTISELCKAHAVLNSSEFI